MINKLKSHLFVLFHQADPALTVHELPEDPIISFRKSKKEQQETPEEEENKEEATGKPEVEPEMEDHATEQKEKQKKDGQ